MAEILVLPEQFTLVPYDADVLRDLVAETLALVEFPAGVDVTLEVDEELFSPLVFHASDVVGGRAHLWVGGGDFEDTRRPREFSQSAARIVLAVCALRAKDRLSADFGGAPDEGSLTLAERAAWDASAYGRAQRLGLDARESKRRYEFRLQHGFSDAADAAFDRLWAAPAVTWDMLREICAETGAADRPKGRYPVDTLRRR